MPKKKAVPKKTARTRLVKKTTFVLPAVSSFPEQSLDAHVVKAKKVGRWIAILVRVEDNMVHVERVAKNFKKGDIDTAMRLIVEDLQKLKEQ